MKTKTYCTYALTNIAMLLALSACDSSVSSRDTASESVDIREANEATLVKRSVSASHKADNNFAWKSKFSYELTPSALVVYTRISVLPVDEIRVPRLEAVKGQWHQDIHSKWNNRFQLSYPDGRTIPIRFSIKFTPINPDHKVLVRRGMSANQHNWTTDMPAEAASHEFGHMLGAYDEYRAGALSLDHPLIDRNSIMGSRLSNSLPEPRHLSLLESDLKVALNKTDLKITLLETTLN